MRKPQQFTSASAACTVVMTGAYLSVGIIGYWSKVTSCLASELQGKVPTKRTGGSAACASVVAVMYHCYFGAFSGFMGSTAGQPPPTDANLFCVRSCVVACGSVLLMQPTLPSPPLVATGRPGGPDRAVQPGP